MDEQMVNYYSNMAGSGIVGYSGVRYQKGNGFMGRLISGVVLPFLRYFGRKALKTGTNVAQDVLNGETFSKSLKSNMGTTAREVLKDGVEKARKLTGSGVLGVRRGRSLSGPMKKLRLKKPIEAGTKRKSIKGTKKAPKRTNLFDLEKLVKKADFLKKK